MTDNATVIRRVIDESAWNQRLLPSLDQTGMVKVTKDADQSVLSLRRKADGTVQVRPDGGKWATASAQLLDTIRQRCSWDARVVNTADDVEDVVDLTAPAALTSNVGDAGKVPMDVQTVGGDRHSIVHYSTKTYKHTTGGAKNPTTRGHRGDHHLTVENAHLLLMAELKANKTTAYVDKTKLEKPDVEKQLDARGMNPIDNLNFYPAPDRQGPTDLSAAVIAHNRLDESEHPESAQVDRRLSLDEYLRFIQRALASIPDVPPVYGAKILATARDMHRLTGWDPAAMYLRAGSGDHRHLTRAVMAMHTNGLVNGLNLPNETAKVFARYPLSAPQLPVAEPVTDDTEWVSKASLSADKSVHYNELETRYVEAHSKRVIDAIQAFIQ